VTDLHTKVCSIKTSQPVPCLKLIDCVTRTIVLALNHPYVALSSYVWGQSSATHEYVEILPKDLPHTIEDSITVTKKLGFRYLWIDRYCINQERKEEVSEQVQKMNLIYQNAEVTIIASAREDPTYGLPGVGHRKRDPRTSTAYTKIGNHFLISAGLDPHRLIASSKWRTRAWTYQELMVPKEIGIYGSSRVL
jgi:hypothetical protein